MEQCLVFLDTKIIKKYIHSNYFREYAFLFYRNIKITFFRLYMYVIYAFNKRNTLMKNFRELQRFN